MSRKGNPYDNASCESFMKTLKYEEVYRQEYRDLAEARASIEQFIEQDLQQKRLHSALGYRPPAEFELSLTTSGPAAGINRRWPYEKRGRPQNAFFQAWRNLSVRCVVTSCKPGPGCRLPWSGPVPGYRTRREEQHALPIVRDEFRPAIPQRVARQHCPSPLHRQSQLKSICPVGEMHLPSNGKQCLNCLSQPRGQPHSMAEDFRIARKVFADEEAIETSSMRTSSRTIVLMSEKVFADEEAIETRAGHRRVQTCSSAEKVFADEEAIETSGSPPCRLSLFSLRRYSLTKKRLRPDSRCSATVAALSLRRFSLTKKRLRRIAERPRRVAESQTEKVFADEEAIETHARISARLPALPLRRFSLTKKRLRPL